MKLSMRPLSILSHTIISAGALFSVTCATAASPGEMLQVDSNLSKYAKVAGVSGNLNSIGSDTLNNLMTLWAESFSHFYPNVRVQIEGKGSSTAPPALIEATSQLGPMSRKMKASEVDKFEAKFGYKPTPIKTAVDSLAVFVHRDNPIKGLSLRQVDAIFSKTRRLGEKTSVTTWGQLGLGGEWANKPISLYGRNSASGTYGFFKKHALGKGDYRDEVKEQPGSASVVQSVSVDKYSIGYSGIGYKTSGVKAVPLVGKKKGAFVEATASNALNGSYPLARFLYVYLNKQPNEQLQPLTREFIKLILSKDGQEVVVKDGYYPLPAKVANEELAKLK